MLRKTISTTLILTAVIGLSACGSLSKVRGALGNNGDVNYQNNQAVKQLEVPPDLTQPEFDNAFELPKGLISAVSLKNGTTLQQQDVTSSAQSDSKAGAVRRGDLSSIKTVAGKTVLQVNDTYPRSQVLTEIMMTRIGFSTVSKSSGGDVITAKYNGGNIAASEAKSSGFMSKFKNIVTFGGERRKLNSNMALVNDKEYRATISNEQGSPIVRFTRVDGQNISGAAHAKIIALLNTAFNS